MPRLTVSAKSFDPEAIRVLVSAFDSAWRRLISAGQMNGDPEAARTELARQVFRLAAQGEANPRCLTRNALLAFRRLGLVKAVKPTLTGQVPSPLRSTTGIGPQ